MYTIKRFRFLFVFIISFISVFSSNSALASTNVTDDITSNITWNLAGSPYIVQNSINISAGSILTIDAGVIVKFAPYTELDMYDGGNILANGTDTNKIYFTSLSDDTVGGDTNADGSATTPDISDNSNTFWYGLNISNCYSQTTSDINLQNVVFRYADTGINLCKVQNTNISNSTFENNRTGIADWGQSTVNISNTKVLNNNIGIHINQENDLPASVYTVSNSSIHNNANYGLLSETHIPPLANNWKKPLHFIADLFSPQKAYADTYSVDFRNTWWGDASGPLDLASNTNGLGDKISGDVLFSPWLTTDPFFVRTPVILIPGIMGSYLNQDFGDNSEVWININHMIGSISDDFLDDLALLSDGTEDSNKPIQVGDIIRTITATIAGHDFVTHSFDGLIDELTSAGYTEGTDLFVFPYDWRKSSADAAILLDSKIAAILSQTGASKVDIVAHSMGGLVAKDYIAHHGAGLIDKLIFLGTPHLGAPKAYKVLTYGDDMGISLFDGKISFLKSSEVKYISQNMQGVFELLPSQKYITDVGPYVTNAKNNPVQDLDYTDTKDFMNTQGRNIAILILAESVHNDIDNLNLSGTNVYNFAGCGKTKTIGKIRVGKKRDWTHLGLTWKDDVNITYTNGDETVPLSSADSIDSSNKYFVKNISHMDIPSADGLKQDVLAILLGSALPSSSIILSDEADCATSGHAVSVHSPVTLDIYDSSGNHTGLNSDGDIEYGIPTVSYDIFDDVKYAFLPDGQDYKIVNHATDTGGYSLVIDDVANNDDITNTFSWNLVPLQTLDTTAEINIGPSYPENEYVLKADENGDGTFDKNFPVNFDGTSLAEKVEEELPHHSIGGSTLAFLDRKDDDKKEDTEVKNIEINNPNIEIPKTILKEIKKVQTLKKLESVPIPQKKIIKENKEQFSPKSQTASTINTDFDIKNMLTVLAVCILAFIIGKRFINKI